MSIVQPADFTGKFSLANNSEPYIINLIQASINDYEPKLLTALLGAELYTLLLAGLAVNPQAAKWVTLKTKVFNSILAFVYWNYQRDNVTITTGTGEVKSKNANSAVVSPGRKMKDRWNEMVVNNRNVVAFIQGDTADYGVYYNLQWPYCFSDSDARSIFVEQNLFGL